MTINSKISSFVIGGFFLASLCLGSFSVITLLNNQNDSLKTAKSELLEISRELTQENANFFFSLLDKEFQSQTSPSYQVVLDDIAKIAPAYINNVIVVDMNTKSVLKGYDNPGLINIVNQDVINDCLNKYLLNNKSDFYLDNYEQFLMDKKGAVIPVCVHLRVYKDQGLMIGYGKAMETTKVRIEFMKRKNAEYFWWHTVISLIIYILAPVIIVIMLIYLMRISFLDPLKKIGFEVNRIAGGDLTARIRLDQKDEIGNLARELNKMAQDLQGTTTSIANLNKEIAERKIVTEALTKAYGEIKDVQMQLLQSEKLASIGQLAAGVAHEINNPIGFISNNLEMLAVYMDDYTKILKMYDGLMIAVEQGDLEKSRQEAQGVRSFTKDINLEYLINDLKKLFEQTQKGIDRVQKIVKDLRTFAREGTDTFELIKVEEVIDSVLNIVSNELKYKADLKKSYGDTPFIKGSSQRLGQVFINLLVNATQAIEGKGIVEIKTYVEGNNVCIDVRDTGKGIKNDDLKKIFDPFFTTKPVGQGTGLGLSVSYEIIKKHGGEMRAQSKEGEGSTMTVSLPIPPPLT